MSLSYFTSLVKHIFTYKSICVPEKVVSLLPETKDSQIET